MRRRAAIVSMHGVSVYLLQELSGAQAATLHATLTFTLEQFGNVCNEAVNSRRAQ